MPGCFQAVQNLQGALDLPLEKMAAVLGMSRATLHRRKTQGKIDSARIGAIGPVSAIAKKAEGVFGDVASAREWLTHKQPGLVAQCAGFCETEIGAREVENLLGRIEYGVYS
jgi:putative toxin-antitoxin system antitoxin component (TIGR02293 family)